MSTKSEDQLIGASAREEELYQALMAHERDEREVIAEYQRFAENTSSETVRYLINLIVEDEQRHHQVLNELANNIRFAATLEERGERVPLLDVHRSDQALRQASKRFLAIERRDRSAMSHLARQAKREGSEVDAFVIDLLRSDTQRHIRILRFIDHLARHSPLR